MSKKNKQAPAVESPAVESPAPKKTFKLRSLEEQILAAREKLAKLEAKTEGRRELLEKKVADLNVKFNKAIRHAQEIEEKYLAAKAELQALNEKA